MNQPNPQTTTQPRPDNGTAAPAAAQPPDVLAQALEGATQRFLVEQRMNDVLSKLPMLKDFAGMVGKTPVMPGWILKTPDPAATALAVFMKGAELGLQPMASLEAIYMVDGKTQLSAATMRAIVTRAGLACDIIEQTLERCVVRIARPGRPGRDFEWTSGDAKRAKLDGKDNWLKYPRAMLLARASADACRAMAPDLLAGCYTPDEIEEMRTVAWDPVDANIPEPAPAKPRTLEDIAAGPKTAGAPPPPVSQRRAPKRAEGEAAPIDITGLLGLIGRCTTDVMRSECIEKANAVHKEFSAEQQVEIKAALAEARKRIDAIRAGAVPDEQLPLGEREPGSDG